MSGQYFDNNPSLKHKSLEYQVQINGKTYRFLTDSGVFSRTFIDFGTKTLIESFNTLKTGLSVLDLGCGYGPVGIIMKKSHPTFKVLSTDINKRAVSLAEQNKMVNQVEIETRVSDGFSNIEEQFDLIFLNPPIRAGKETIFRLYDEAYDHLNNLGELWIVIQKKQGAESTIKKMESRFNNCEVITKNKGYFILKSIKS